MQLAQYGNQTLFVDDFLFGGQRLAGTQLFQHVVYAGQGQLGVLGLLAFAVGVEAFGQVADLCLLLWRGFWEGEGFKAAGVVVAGIIADA